MSAPVIMLPIAPRREARRAQEYLRFNRDNVVILPVVRIERLPVSSSAKRRK